MSLKAGAPVVLICREDGENPDWPPVGAVGEVVTELDEWNEYDIYFPDHIWGETDPPWVIPAGWVVPIGEDPDQISASEPESLTA